MIDFGIEPAFQARLAWIAAFVRDAGETMDLLWPDQGACYDTCNAPARAHLRPLQERVRAQGLWACHLGPQLGGPGFGQVKLALMNEILGRSNWAPTVFGTAAFADGPTDAHRLQLARALLKQAPTAPGMFPSEHIPTRTAAARARYPQGS